MNKCNKRVWSSQTDAPGRVLGAVVFVVGKVSGAVLRWKGPKADQQLMAPDSATGQHVQANGALREMEYGRCSPSRVSVSVVARWGKSQHRVPQVGSCLPKVRYLR